MDLLLIEGDPSALGLCAVIYRCSGVAWIYDQLPGGSICLGSMCSCLNVKLIWCSGVEWIYEQLTGGSICLGYMCIHLYVKLIWCSGHAWIYD